MRGGEALGAQRDVGVKRAGGQQPLKRAGASGGDPARRSDEHFLRCQAARCRSSRLLVQRSVGQQEQRGGIGQSGVQIDADLARGRGRRRRLLADLITDDVRSQDYFRQPPPDWRATGKHRPDITASAALQQGQRAQLSLGGQHHVVVAISGEQDVDAGLLAVLLEGRRRAASAVAQGRWNVAGGSRNA